MESIKASQIFGAMSSPIRLDIVQLLVRYAPDGLVAGEIARLLHILATNLSFHLRELTACGLVTVEREGRYQRYRADIVLIRGVIAYLTEECCTGRQGGGTCGF